MSKRYPWYDSGWLSVYMELGKARLSALVVLTTAMGYLLAAGPVIGEMSARDLSVAALQSAAAACELDARSFGRADQGKAFA